MIKYKWGYTCGSIKRFTIFCVPIFAVTQEREVTQDDLQAIINTFNTDKATKQYLPRIFLGHHTSTEDRQGVGFLDNFVFKGDKDIIYADLIDITEDVFCQLRELRFPYHSVEYVKEKQEISGLALLDSQPPFFKFPRRILDEIGIPLPENYTRRNNMPIIEPNPKGNISEQKPEIMNQKFHDTLASIESILQKLAAGIETLVKQQGEKEPKQEEKVNMAKFVEENPNPEELEPMKEEEIAKLPKEKIEELKAKLVEILKEKSEESDEEVAEKAQKYVLSKKFLDGMDELIARDAREKPPMRKPVVGSMAGFSSNDIRVQQLEKEVSRMKFANIVANMNVSKQEKQALLNTLERFSTDKDREIFLNGIAEAPKHSNFAASVANSWSAIKPETYEKYPEESRQVAFEASNVWKHTSSHSDQRVAKQFRNQFPDVEKFVKHVVEMEAINPGYLKTLCIESK